jgi:HEAT repeat protein
MTVEQPDHSAYLLREFDAELRSSDDSIRKTALTCLIRLGSGPEIFEWVQRLAQEDADAEIRFMARKAMDRLNIKERPEFREARILIRRLLENRGEKRKKVYERVFSSEDSFMKLELLICLFTDDEAKQDSKILAELLTGLISSEKDRSLVPSYVKGLGIFGDASALPLLQRCLQSKNPRVVANAIDALETLGDDCAQNMVLPLLSHSDNRVRANAVKLVFGFDPERAVQELKHMGQSSKPWMRISTLYCLRVMDFSERKMLLTQIFIKEQDPEVLLACLKLVSHLGDSDFAKVLIRRLANFPENLRTELESTLQEIIQNHGLDRNQLLRSLQMEAETERQAESREAKAALAEKSSRQWVERSAERRKLERRKALNWRSSPLIPLTVALFFIFILLRLGYETGIVSKGYTLDVLSRTRSLSTQATQFFFEAEYLRGRHQFATALKKYNQVLAANSEHQKSIRGRKLCETGLKTSVKQDRPPS